MDDQEDYPQITGLSLLNESQDEEIDIEQSMIDECIAAEIANEWVSIVE